MKKKGRNVAASVRQRLLNIAKEQDGDLQRLVTRYALERLLYRLTLSDYEEEFVLKGAMLFGLWLDEPHRMTRDLDLLGFGNPSPERLETVFRDIIQIEVDDGLSFDLTSLSASPIREDKVYEGVRVKFFGELHGAKILCQVDVGFGDAITPIPKPVVFPSLLDFPRPHVRAYARETVVAEKLEAMVSLDIANSRMKDFYDLWILSDEFDFDGKTLAAAIHNTFDRRRTPIPEEPLALTPAFYEDEGKRKQWTAFVRRGRLKRQEDVFGSVVPKLRAFLLPALSMARSSAPADRKWPAGGPWAD